VSTSTNKGYKMITYNDKDFRVEVTKGSGPGGQHRNKVETCVKIIHLPTGITETCQDTRSKLKNLTLAKRRIVDKLNAIILDRKNAIVNESRKNQINTGERTFRRRTYDYKTQVVTDHITKKRAPLQQVLDGHIELLH
jgi:peptide chain release factor 1